MTHFERYNLEITPPADAWNSRVNPEVWKHQIELLLAKIEATDAGKALLENMTKKTQGGDPAAWIQIRPYSSDHYDPLVCNAEVQPIRISVPGTFRWRMAVVLFEPNQYHSGSHCFNRRGLHDPANASGKEPDEVLFHELVHAHRWALRMRNDAEVRGALHKYTSPEEFLAVVITNIYISDTTNKNASTLRGSHRSGTPLEAELADSIGFYAASADVYPLLSKFADEEWPLFNALARVKATFNPLRALKENEEWVKAAAGSDLARKRDIAGEAAEKVHRERFESEQILIKLGFLPGGRPRPQLRKAASDVLSPLAKSAIEILRR